MAPASTGSDSSSRKAVTRIDHTNNGIRCRVMPGARMLKIVVMKLMAPRIEEAPAICRAKIAISTDGPSWPVKPNCEPTEDKGGYIVQPVPAPPPTTVDSNSSAKDGISSQKLMLFMRGNAISGAPIMIGTIQLPKPPIMAGITMKKIMMRPCDVISTL